MSEAAEAGIPVRLLLDATLDKDPSGNPATEARFNEMGEMGLDMAARLMSPYHNFTVVHNKGWVVDDKVVISSVNLVRNAFEENREVGLIVRSPAIADWYARSFWEDWKVDPSPPYDRATMVGMQHFQRRTRLPGRERMLGQLGDCEHRMGPG